MIPAEDWRGPDAPIWALVCGFPEDKARKRPLLMFRAFVDDSGTGGAKTSPVFVLAGYISPAERWVAFSKEWKELLDYYKLDRFKMAEANERWLVRREIEPLIFFYRIIQRNATSDVRFIVPYAVYDQVLQRLPFRFEDSASIYLLAFTSLLNTIARARESLGISGRVDFVFDRGTFPKDLIDRDWELMLNVASDEARDMLGRTPIWASDDEELPLQAADFNAWWVLNGWRNNPEAPADWRYPWSKGETKIPGFEASWDESSLYNFLLDIGRSIGASA